MIKVFVRDCYGNKTNGKWLETNDFGDGVVKETENLHL